MKRTPTMKNVLAIGMLLTVQLFLASCATTASQIAFHEVPFQDKDSAIIYVYRLRSMVGAIASWAVRLDTKIVAMLKQNAYVVLQTSPGTHTITIGDSMAPIFAGAFVGGVLGGVVLSAMPELGVPIAGENDTITVAANGVYFLRSAGFDASFVSREEAMKEIVRMKYDTGS